MTAPRFPLGRVVGTANALERLNALGIDPLPLLRRHITGDWGDVGPEDRALNDEALADGGRLMSVYKLPAVTVWIITEWDRSVTTILLPEDY
jgi:hypothetical protein